MAMWRGFGVGEPGVGELILVVVGWGPHFPPIIGHVLGGKLWDRHSRLEGATSRAPNVVGPLFELLFPFGLALSGGAGGLLSDSGVEAAEAIVNCGDIVACVADYVVAHSCVPTVVVAGAEGVLGTCSLAKALGQATVKLAKAAHGDGFWLAVSSGVADWSLCGATSLRTLTLGAERGVASLAGEAEGEFGAGVPVVPPVGQRSAAGQAGQLLVDFRCDVVVVVKLPAAKVGYADVWVPHKLCTFAEAGAWRSHGVAVADRGGGVRNQVVVRYARKVAARVVEHGNVGKATGWCGVGGSSRLGLGLLPRVL